MKIFKILFLVSVLFMGSIGLAGANALGPDGINWEAGADVGIEQLLSSDFFRGYAPISTYDFEGLYAYTAIAHESGHVNVIRDGRPSELPGGGMEERFTTDTNSNNDYFNWGRWLSINFDGENQIKFLDAGDGKPSSWIDPYSTQNDHAKFFKFFQLEETSEALTWLNGDPILPQGTIIAGWSDNADGDAYMDGDFDDLIIAIKPVPEPGTILLLGLGLMGVAGLGRRMKK
jgi:hypothetical protein